MLKIPEIYKLEIFKLMFRHTRYNIPERFCSFFKNISSIHIRTTRSSSNRRNYYLPCYRSNKLQRSLKYQGVKIWNSLPNNLKEKMVYTVFKNVRKSILQVYTNIHVISCYLLFFLFFLIVFFFWYTNRFHSLVDIRGCSIRWPQDSFADSCLQTIYFLCHSVACDLFLFWDE